MKPRVWLLIGLAALFAGPVHAQQAPTTALDRLAPAYGQCIGTAERQVDQIGELQRQNAALQKQIADLTAKPAPASEPPK